MKTTASALSLFFAPSVASAHASAAQATQYFESNSVVSLIALLMAFGAVVCADLLSKRRRSEGRILARVSARSR